MEHFMTLVVFRDEILTRMPLKNIVVLSMTCHTIYDILMSDEIWEILSRGRFPTIKKYKNYTWKQHFYHLTKINVHKRQKIIKRMIGDSFGFTKTLGQFEKLCDILPGPVPEKPLDFLRYPRTCDKKYTEQEKERIWIVYAEIEKPLSGLCAERYNAYKKKSTVKKFLNKYKNLQNGPKYLCCSCSANWYDVEKSQCPYCGLGMIEKIYGCQPKIELLINFREYEFLYKFPCRIRIEAPNSPLVEILDTVKCPTIDLDTFHYSNNERIIKHMFKDTIFTEYFVNKNKDAITKYIMNECDDDLLKLMYDRYHGVISGFCAKRYESYMNGNSEWFISQLAFSCLCMNCDARWYRNANTPNQTHACPKCNKDVRIYIRHITWRNIPPWIDINTFVEYTTGVPKYIPDTRPRKSSYDKYLECLRDSEEYDEYFESIETAK